MRTITLIIIHCSAVRPDQQSSAAQIDTWHGTEAQKQTMRRLLEELHERYPRAVIVGHHDLNPHKACPCIINVAHEYRDLQPK